MGYRWIQKSRNGAINYHGTHSRLQANKHVFLTSDEIKSIEVLVSSIFCLDTDSTEADGQKRVRPAEKKSWIDSLRYPWLLIGLLATVIITVISVTAWFYWKLKKTRASSPPAIASLRPRYDARNEYVVVPDFKWNSVNYEDLQLFIRTTIFETLCLPQYVSRKFEHISSRK